MSAPTYTPARLGHQPALDGLRGVAVAAVFGLHFEWPWIPGGHFGVDVFFVLSGFLITTLLLEEHFQSGRIALRAFFFRRIVRLYPALIALVIFSTTFTLLLHREVGLTRTVAVASSVLFYYANWLSIMDSAAWFGGMPHTWSLAIEAQFYVLWALTIAGLARRYPQPEQKTALLKILTAIAVSIVLASAGWRAWLWADGAVWLRTYLGTDTHLDSVFVGVIVALLRLQQPPSPLSPDATRPNQRGFTLLATGCVAGIAILFHAVPFGTALPGNIEFTLISLATAGLLYSILLFPNAVWGVVLRWQPLVWLGKISYSLYIWHVAAVKFLKTDRLLAAGLPHWAAESVRVVLSLLIAAASYHLIERTFLRWKNRHQPSQSATGTNPLAADTSRATL